ncbi:MAG: hypothetical protein H0X25_00925 [Acidobacteriales bacterium]|nr:hypothetical protein [Terriglobales bacterium]
MLAAATAIANDDVGKFESDYVRPEGDGERAACAGAKLAAGVGLVEARSVDSNAREFHCLRAVVGHGHILRETSGRRLHHEAGFLSAANLRQRIPFICRNFEVFLPIAEGSSPHLSATQSNAFAERWVRSVKEGCLSRLIFFGEPSLRRALSSYVEHYHGERNHQGKGNKLLFPLPAWWTGTAGEKQSNARSDWEAG